MPALGNIRRLRRIEYLIFATDLGSIDRHTTWALLTVSLQINSTPGVQLGKRTWPLRLEKSLDLVTVEQVIERIFFRFCRILLTAWSFTMQPATCPKDYALILLTNLAFNFALFSICFVTAAIVSTDETDMSMKQVIYRQLTRSLTIVARPKHATESKNNSWSLIGSNIFTSIFTTHNSEKYTCKKS